MKDILLNGDVVFLYDKEDFKGINTVMSWVAEDFGRVFGKRPEVAEIAGFAAQSGRTVIAALSPKSKYMKAVLAENGLDGVALTKADGSYKWEVYLKAAAGKLLGNDVNGIVIAGSDKRGTMYGLLSLSESIGVSPFVNWSGAAPAHRDSVTVTPSGEVSKEPSVKYRGIFINDEWPAFGSWSKKRFGGINARCYFELFELLLRMRGNYMWPAMWSSNFSMDGPGLESAALADELGIVMSTSHHEPCMRTGEEYRLLRGKDSPYGDAWDFLSNREGITRFWEDGLKRNAPFENVITMGMRGERDTAIMAQATLAENIALLRDILATQNKLIKEIIDPDLTKVPRQIVLFTEVEKFYYGDEETPGLIGDPETDGVTVMFSDTNYGYTRTLPTEKMRGRNGGYGLYYHLDIHGGAYSYEWIGSTYLPRIWDQLSTAYDHDVREIWVVNVGDLVSQELEISYIMKLAFDIESYGSANPNNAEEYVRRWVKALFGGYFDAADLDRIEKIIWDYSLINERRKHEVMNEKVYHPVHYGEAEELFARCRRVMDSCGELLAKCPEQIRTAFFELIYYPAYGTANLSRTWIASEWNKFYADQNRNTANDWCVEIDAGMKRDRELIGELHTVADGKFYGHGLSEHFGFRFWNDSNNQLPTRLYVYPANNKRMLVSVKGETFYMDGREYTVREKKLDIFMRPDVTSAEIEVSCASVDPIAYTAKSEADWLTLSSAGGSTSKTDTVTVTIDRTRLEAGREYEGAVTVRETGEQGNFVRLIFTAALPVCRDEYKGAFLETDGVVAMEARSAQEITQSTAAHYQLLTPYGRHGSGLKLYPNTLDPMTLGAENVPYAEYRFVTRAAGEYDAEFIFAPSVPVNDSNSQCFGCSVNGGDMVTADTVYDRSCPIFWSAQWAQDNLRNAKCVTVRVSCVEGLNVLRYHQLSPNLILERIVLRAVSAEVRESYLGPRESYRLV